MSASAKSSARRAFKFMDPLIKRVEALGLVVQIRDSDSGGYRGSRSLTYITDKKEGVQLAVIEKTSQRLNPAWGSKDSWHVHEYVFHPTGRFSIVLDDAARALMEYTAHYRRKKSPQER